LAKAKRLIWLIGPFPPPLHGQAVYNAAFAPHLEHHGELRVLPTGEGFASKLNSYGRILLVALFRVRRSDIVYTSMPGQMAAWLFALVVAALRLRGIRHFVHHHSFRSLALPPLRNMRLVVALGGRQQHHILLSPIMRDRFAARYLKPPDAARAFALSNALLFCPARATTTPRPSRAWTVGHLSVLTRHKGVDTLIALFRAMAPSCPELRLILAGPIADETLEPEIAGVVADFPGRAEYRGTVSGEAKRDFFQDIDLFVLPTRLIDEAEPLVMLESYAAGVEFMAPDRGCIAERLRRPDRLLTGDERADAARILAVLAQGAVDWEASRRACAEHATALHGVAVGEAERLFAEMLAAAPLTAAG
jgi:glycosyltransferase involved in cell wall biosynthesis